MRSSNISSLQAVVLFNIRRFCQSQEGRKVLLLSFYIKLFPAAKENRHICVCFIAHLIKSLSKKRKKPVVWLSAIKHKHCVPDSFQAPWGSLGGGCGEQYCLVWESRFLRDLGSAMTSLLDGLVSMVAQEALKYTVLSGSTHTAHWLRWRLFHTRARA